MLLGRVRADAYLEVVDFLWFGRPVDLSQGGSADQRGELRVGELFEWLPESGRWFLWPHPHPQSRCQDVLLIGLALHLLHQRLLFLVDLVGLSGWHSAAASLFQNSFLFVWFLEAPKKTRDCFLLLKASLYQKILLALSQLSWQRNCMIWSREITRKGNPIGRAEVQSWSSHSSDSGWSPVCVTGLPGFVQKRCSPKCSCASLENCMQMSWVVCTNPLLPVQSWYSPWNGHSALLWNCWGSKRGRSRGAGSVVDSEDEMDPNQPITARIRRL